MSPGKRRRVTFADQPSVVVYVPTTHSEGQEDETDDQPHATRPGAGPAGSAEQPGTSVQRQNELETMQGLEDESVMNDVAAAEEDYDAPAQAFNEAGIAFEPFHLKQEREEGYFDAEGNYIQYKLDEVKDAWLDSLKDGDVSTGPSKPQSSGTKQASMNMREQELDADELLAYKRRLLDLLQPYETVLAALRRLGGLQQAGQPSAATPWKRTRKAAGADAAPINAAASPEASVSSHMRAKRTVPVENGAEFDRLTEYSSLLLQHGDYNIHSTPREAMAAAVEAAEAAELQAVMGVLSTACTSEAQLESDPAVRTGSLPSQPTVVSQSPGSTQLQAPSEVAADAPSVLGLIDSASAQEAANAAAAAQQVPADPEDDIFGQSDTLPSKEHVSSDANSAPASLTPPTKPDSIQQKTVGGASAVDDEAPAENSGYMYDEQSGTWYNADLNFYYDSSHGLYGDASSGHWYSYSDGMYQLVC